METNWIETEIAKGLQGLLCLSLDRQPALELIEGTVMMWCKVITNGRVFDEARDVERFRSAFLTLGARKTWPVPSDFIESLPSNVKPFVKPLRIDDERVRKARMRSFAEISKTLGIHDDDQTPPEAS
jgi:hypothetical protein